MRDSVEIRVLLIDDEPVLRATFQYMLQDLGYRVWVAANGREGLELLCRVHPDVVITDIVMPELDGFATIDAIRDRAPSLPIIAMSGAVDERRMERHRGDGVFCCVRKPVEPATLSELIHAMLEPEPGDGL